jgi:hypothetical protein
VLLIHPRASISRQLFQLLVDGFLYGKVIIFLVILIYFLAHMMSKVVNYLDHSGYNDLIIFHVHVIKVGAPK